jgi:hypothetical protein
MERAKDLDPADFELLLMNEELRSSIKVLGTTPAIDSLRLTAIVSIVCCFKRTLVLPVEFVYGQFVHLILD